VSARQPDADLLEALEAMVSDWGGFRTYEGDKPDSLKLAEAAIARATKAGK
jgi:hypothetical protein